MTQITNTRTITCLGECMVELTDNHDGYFRQNFAGDTLNTTTYLTRILNGKNIATNYVTALGHDHFSTGMLQQWADENINTRFVVQLPDKRPGIYTIEVDSFGERSFNYWRSDSAARQLFTSALSEQQIETIANESDVLFLSGISIAILPCESRKDFIKLLSLAKTQGAKIVFDTNHRPALWEKPETAKYWYDEVIKLTDIALLTFDDEKLLYGDSMPEETATRLRHVPELIIKMGSEPCLVKTENTVEWVPPQTVDKPVDTTGAGDSFNAGYLASRVKGLSPVEACQTAHKLAACVIMHQGGIIPAEAMPEL